MEDNTFERALAYHKSGNLQEAAKCYQSFLRAHPDHADALYLFACLAYQTGHPGPAAATLARALKIAPNQPHYLNALGLAATELEKFDEAEDCFQRAIQLANQPEFHNNFGMLRKRQGRLEEAVAEFRQAVLASPDFADAHYNLGNTYRAKGELAAAIKSFRKVLDISPMHFHGAAALAQTLVSANQNEEAIALLQKAVGLRPDNAELHCELGDALQAAGQLEPARTEYQAALRSNPGLARPWYSAGCIETARKDYVAAIEAYRKAVDFEPDWLEARHNLAQSLFQMGRVTEAMTEFRICAKHERGAISRGMIAVIIPGDPKADNAAILEARRGWAERDLLQEVPDLAPLPRSLDAGRPLRIGYISSFFHRDNWMKPVWGLLNRHDRERFQIHLFSDSPGAKISSGYRPDPRDRCHAIHSMSNSAAAALIRESGIDILVDLNGYSKTQRLELYTLRPAPKIVGWFNMYATTGIAAFDYLIGDDTVLPPDEEVFYTERILRVPGSYLTFEVKYPVPEVRIPPAQNSGFRFGCLASQYKITPGTMDAWSAILKAAPNATLLLKNSALGLASSRQFVHDQFQDRGIAPERIELEGPADHYRFLDKYGSIDLALDPFPYNGGTTTTEAIWQGVPVLAYWGDRWVARTSASLLRAAGLEEFVARDVEHYVELGIWFATAPEAQERLLALRNGMRSQLSASAVCDTAGFARNMESLYMKIHAGRGEV